MMEVSAILRRAGFSAQKARLVLDQIRGLSVEKASDVLLFSSKKSAKTIKKVLDSAIANAEHNNGLDIDELYVSVAYADGASTMKRTMPRAKGRADRILKRTCHLTVKVSDMQREGAK